MKRGDLATIQSECGRILSNSRIARRIIAGCAATIVGPPNSGKSALFNRLCGTNKSIVADIGGTTRDWVSTIWRIPSLRMELFDTAGLDPALAAADPLEAASQQRTQEIIRQADVVIAVLDGSKPPIPFSPPAVQGQIVIAVRNKSDLPQSPDLRKLPFACAEWVSLSARTGDGVDDLAAAIRRATGVEKLDLAGPVCFTQRQVGQVTQLAECHDPGDVLVLLEQLLMGSPRV
jgi:tRNA modification GTPase